MARRRKGSSPSYCHHKQSGQAVFNWPLGGGEYKDILLGKHGSQESHTEYERVLGEWRAAHGSPAPALKSANGQPADLTLYEIALFDNHADQHYRNPTTGEPTGEADNFKSALQYMLDLYGHCSWRQFGPLALRAVRIEMVKADLRPKDDQRPDQPYLAILPLGSELGDRAGKQLGRALGGTPSA